MSFEAAWPLTVDLVTVFITGLIVIDTSLRLTGSPAAWLAEPWRPEWTNGCMATHFSRFFFRIKRRQCPKSRSPRCRSSSRRRRTGSVAAAEQP